MCHAIASRICSVVKVLFPSITSASFRPRSPTKTVDGAALSAAACAPNRTLGQTSTTKRATVRQGVVSFVFIYWPRIGGSEWKLQREDKAAVIQGMIGDRELGTPDEDEIQP